MTSRGKESYSIQSVENALAVLEAMSEEGDDFRISQLSEKLGMNKTSIFRLLATFENRGYVEREKGSGKYRLGLSAYEMGQKFLSRMGLLRMARPVMEQLGRSCDEALYLAVRRKDEVLFLDMVETSHRVKVVSLLGNRYPLSAIPAGKVILAFTRPEEIPTTPQTVTTEPGVPLQELSRIRNQGFCVDAGSPGDGIVSMAVPLLRSGAELSGTLCMVGPEFRMTSMKIQNELLPQIKESGEIISSKMGYLGHFI